MRFKRILQVAISTTLTVSLAVSCPIFALAESDTNNSDTLEGSESVVASHAADAVDAFDVPATADSIADSITANDSVQPASNVSQSAVRLDQLEGDTPFSPFDESARLDITTEEAIERFLSSNEEGAYNAQYLSAARFEAVLRYALNFHGWEYVWGGKSPSTSFDCSGLVSHVYGHVLGASMYTNASGIYTGYCSYVSPSDARPGDLVFWHGTYGTNLSAITHVGIYCGNDIVYAAGDPIGFYSVRASKNVLGNPASYMFGRVRSVDSGNVATAVPIADRYNLVFDNGFYAAFNPSVAGYVNDSSYGLSHFANSGMANGWRASVAFDPAYYKNRYSDLRAAFGDDWARYYEHFISHGCAEGRQGSKEFSVQAYKSRYSDLRKAFGDNNKAYVQHFVNYGMREGRRCSDDFVVLNYRNHYPDLQSLYVNNMGAYYGHYLRAGQYEGRTGLDTTVYGTAKLNGTDYSSVYDYAHYVSNNSDVKRAFAGDPIDTLNHFVNYGMSEGRQAKDTFDAASYYNAYSDLRRAFGTNLRSLTMHYVNHGQSEGRTCKGVPQLQGFVSSYAGTNWSPVYDGKFYYDRYADLRRAFTVRAASNITLFDDTALLHHFVNFGMAEGRQANSSFDVRAYRANYQDLRAAFGAILKAYYLHYIDYGRHEGRSC